MVWYAALTTTTGSGVIVNTTTEVNARMAVWEGCFKGGNMSTTRREGGLSRTSTRNSYPGSVSALLVNDASLRQETKLGRNESEQKEWRTIQGRSNQDKPSSVTSVPTEKPHPRRPVFPATVFEDMDTRITYSRTRDGVRKLIPKKHMREAKYWQ